MLVVTLRTSQKLVLTRISRFCTHSGLKFTQVALQRSQADKTEELADSFSKAYEQTLKKYHSFVVKPIFAVRSIPFLLTRLACELTMGRHAVGDEGLPVPQRLLRETRTARSARRFGTEQVEPGSRRDHRAP